MTNLPPLPPRPGQPNNNNPEPTANPYLNTAGSPPAPATPPQTQNLQPTAEETYQLPPGRLIPPIDGLPVVPKIATNVILNDNYIPRLLKRLTLRIGILLVISVVLLFIFENKFGPLLMVGTAFAAVVGLVIYGVVTHKPVEVDFAQQKLVTKKDGAHDFKDISWSLMKLGANNGAVEYGLKLGAGDKTLVNMKLAGMNFITTKKELEALLSLMPYTSIPQLSKEKNGKEAYLGTEDLDVVLRSLYAGLTSIEQPSKNTN